MEDFSKFFLERLSNHRKNQETYQAERSYQQAKSALEGPNSFNLDFLKEFNLDNFKEQLDFVYFDEQDSTYLFEALIQNPYQSQFMEYLGVRGLVEIIKRTQQVPQIIKSETIVALDHRTQLPIIKDSLNTLIQMLIQFGSQDQLIGMISQESLCTQDFYFAFYQFFQRFFDSCDKIFSIPEIEKRVVRDVKDKNDLCLQALIQIFRDLEIKNIWNFSAILVGLIQSVSEEPNLRQLKLIMMLSHQYPAEIAFLVNKIDKVQVLLDYGLQTQMIEVKFMCLRILSQIFLSPITQLTAPQQHQIREVLKQVDELENNIVRTSILELVVSALQNKKLEVVKEELAQIIKKILINNQLDNECVELITEIIKIILNEATAETKKEFISFSAVIVIKLKNPKLESSKILHYLSLLQVLLRENTKLLGDKRNNEELMEQCEGLSVLENLQEHKNEDVYELAYEVLTDNFDLE